MKTDEIGRAKDLAVDLQRRANELATSASNKMANIYGRSYNPIHSRHLALSIYFKWGSFRKYFFSVNYYFKFSYLKIPVQPVLFEMNHISWYKLLIVSDHELLTVPLRVGPDFLAFKP